MTYAQRYPRYAPRQQSEPELTRLRRMVEQEERRRYDPEREARMPRTSRPHHFAVNPDSDERAATAPIANAAEVEGNIDEDYRPIGNVTLFEMWLGETGTTWVYVWADSFESAFEELAEWADDNTPGHIVKLTIADLKSAARDRGIRWRQGWPDYEDRDFERVVDAAEDGLTLVGHTTLKHGSYIVSHEWGGQEVDPGSDAWRIVVDRSFAEVSVDLILRRSSRVGIGEIA